MRPYRCSSHSLRHLAATAIASAALFGALLPAQNAYAQHVTITYLANPVDSPHNTEEVVQKTVPIISGVANISINTDYIDDISVQNGSAFFVQPTVDPMVTLQETLYNFSGKSFYDLTYTLPDGLYFTQADLTARLFSSAKFSDISLSDAFTLDDAGNPDNGTTVYRTVTFAPLTTAQTPLPNGQSANFTLTFHTPTVTNDTTVYQIFTLPQVAPEPGSLALLAAPLISIVVVRRRRRRAA